MLNNLYELDKAYDDLKSYHSVNCYDDSYRTSLDF